MHNPLPPMRSQFGSFEELPVESDWFRVFKLPNDIIAIAEPYHAVQEVISFLIFGSEKAILFDTGMGVRNIKTIVEKLTALPLVVINSHTHFDHVGGNRLFDFVYMIDEPKTAALSQKGYTLPEEDENLRPEAFFVPVPEWKQFFGGCPVRFLKPGDTFDLGGRILSVDATPGHSPDSLVLVDGDNGLLFCGDTVYPGALYAHLGGSDLATYRRTMRRLADRFCDFTLICSHNEPMRPGSLLIKMADAFDLICTDSQVPCTAENGICRYEFDGFSILKNA